jgi:hypothetical protein
MDFLYDLSGNLVFDMDEVLVNIFPTVYAYYLNHIESFKEFLEPKKLTEMDMDIINQRKDHELRITLLKSQYSELPIEKKMEIVKKIRSTKADREFWKSNIYRNLSPSDLGKQLMYESIINNPKILSVTILTFSSSDELNAHKKAFVDKYFNHPKIKLVPVNGYGKTKGTKKSDVMKKLKINWNVFVDDMVYNIMDFAENFEDIKDKLFFMPKFGYNHLTPEQIKYITDKGGVVSYYAP